MANDYGRSRSPVRAINAGVHPAWGNVAPQTRSWSEAQVRELVPSSPLVPPTYEPAFLACPDCGARVRLALVHASEGGSPHAETAPALRAAPDPGATPNFDEAIRDHKRELIARALEESGGVMTRAAKSLGLKYTTFVAMVHRLGLAETEENGHGE